MRLRRWFLAAMLGVALTSGSATQSARAAAAQVENRQPRQAPPGQTAQAPARPVWLQRLQRWLLALEQHKRDTDDEAARLVAGWSRGDMRTVLDDVLALRDALVRAYAHPERRGGTAISYADQRFSPAEVQSWLGLTDEEARSGDVNRILWAGALLYSDIAMRVPAGERPVVGRSRMVRMRDGQVDGYDYSSGPVWESARELLDEIRPDPAKDALVNLWYRATAAFLLDGQAALSDAAAQLARGRRLFPSDPEILFFSGCLHENYTDASLYEAGRSAALPPGQTLDFGSARSHVRDAAGFFRQALSKEPQLVEARVRLGHVLGLLERHEEAAAELKQAVTALRDPRIRYYAQMLLGREEQALGNREAARGWYERAASNYPEAQAPVFALSQLALQSGDTDGAVRAADRLLQLPLDEADDPWARYLVTTGRRPGALIARLLSSVPAFSRQ